MTIGTPQPVAARNGFLPPVHKVMRLPGAEKGVWQGVAPLPILTDLYGEEAPRSGAALSMAFDDRWLYLRAEVLDPQAVIRPELPADSPDFWRQDHIELRFQGIDDATPEPIQVIAAASGRVWDSRGLWRSPSRLAVRAASAAADRWMIEVAIDRAATGLAGVREFWGVVAHTRWAQGFADIAASTPAELGFAQAERWGRFDLVDESHAITLTHWHTPVGPLSTQLVASVVLVNHREQPIAGAFTVTTQSLDQPENSRTQRVQLSPGQNNIPLTIDLTRPTLRRSTLEFHPDGEREPIELGAVTLRAAVPPIVVPPRAGRNPRLLFCPEGLDAVTRSLTHPIMASLPLPGVDPTGPNQPPPQNAEKHAHSTSLHLHYVGAVEVCLTRWLVDRQRHWIDLATRFVRAALAHTQIGAHTDLLEGNVCPGLALAYDTFAPQLAPDEHDDWRTLTSAFLDQYLRTAEARLWQVTAIPNANPVCNGAGGLLALALLDEHPDATRALAFARKFIRTFLDYCNGPDGGNTEGHQYWQYGLESLLPFVLSMRHALGTDDGILDLPCIRQAGGMFKVGLCADGAMSGVNDTIPMPLARDLAWLVANEHRDAFCLWYGDHSERWYRRREAMGKPTPYRTVRPWTLLYRPDAEEKLPAQPAPALPTSIVLHDIEVAMLRSEPVMTSEWVVGVKGSRPPYTHHNQADTGAYFIDLRGERLIIDPGYYKPQATDHALPIIDGVGPVEPTSWAGRITACGARGEVRWCVCDSTAAYRHAAKRVIRNLLVTRGGVVLLDDIVATGKGNVLTRYTCGGPTAMLSNQPHAFLTTAPSAAMRVELFGPPETRIELLPERDLRDVHWGYRFADCRLFPVTAAYRASDASALVTVFRDAQRATSNPRVERDRKRITITLDQNVLAFSMTDAGWAYLPESMN